MIWSSESRKIISKKLLDKNSFQVVGKRSRITLVENKLRIELNLQFINKLLFWCVIVGWIIMQFQSIQPFKRQPHKIVKHTQTIHRLSPTNCLSVFDHFVGLALKGLIMIRKQPQYTPPLFRNFEIDTPPTMHRKVIISFEFLFDGSMEWVCTRQIIWIPRSNIFGLRFEIVVITCSVFVLDIWFATNRINWKSTKEEAIFWYGYKSVI